jgi:hypothetical protein
MKISINTIDDLTPLPAPPSTPPRLFHTRKRQYISVYAPCVIAGALIIYGEAQGVNETTRLFLAGLALAVGALCGFIVLKLGDKLL